MKPKIDFTKYINERTRDFTGREWVLERIGAWLADPDGERVFLLTGEPGSGKSAIAAHLTQLSLDEAPDGALAPLSAFHFCSARDRRWINSAVFAESLALQLSGHYPAYTEALAEKRGERQIRLDVTQTARDLSGQMTGIVIEELNVSGMSPEDTFMHVVREPLERLCDEEPDTQIVILVDALDETLGYTGKIDIVTLLAEAKNLPKGVRFILTSRRDQKVEEQFWGTESLFLSDAEFDEHNRQDLTEYVNYRMSHDDKLAAKVDNLKKEELSEWISQVTSKAEGNFLYVTFLLSEMAQGERPLDTVAGLPKELDGLYHQSLTRVVKQGQKGWDEYAPLMGVLSVGQASLTLLQLQAFTKESDETLRRSLRNLGQFMHQLGETGEERHYRLYHRSVSDFLHKASLEVKNRELDNRYYLSAKTWHGQILDASRPASGKWADLPADDSYLWHHLGAHLCGAEEPETLRELLLDFDWLQAKLKATDIDAVLADYSLYLAKRAQASPEAQEEDDINLLQRNLSQAAHVLVEDKSQLAGQLWGRLAEHSSPAVQRLLQQAAESPATLRLRPLLPSLREHPALIRTLTGHTDTVEAVAVTPDGQRIISASEDQTLKVWDLASGHLLKTLSGHTAMVVAVAVSPDGQRIISASHDNTLKVWDLTSYDLLKTLRDDTGIPTGVVAVGQLIISASHDGTLKVWELESEKSLNTLKWHSGIINQVTSDGQRLISASDDKTVKVWDLASGDLLKTLRDHTGGVKGVAVTPDGQRIISASSDKTLKVWELPSGDLLKTLRGHASGVADVAVVGQRIISASWDDTLKVWDLASGDLLKTLTGHAWRVRAVAAVGERIISASYDKTLKVWRMPMRDLASDGLANTPTAYTSYVHGLAVSPDGQRVISASYDKTLKVWDIANGNLVKILTGHTQGVTGVAIVGQRIISASWDKTLKVWDLVSYRELHTLIGHTDEVTGVAAVGERIISASKDGTLKVWDLADGRQLHTLSGHTKAVTAVAAVGQQIISASKDGTLKVWDLADGRQLHTLTSHTRGVTRLAVVEQRVISASTDGTLKVWDLTSGKLVKRLTEYSGVITGVAAVGQWIISVNNNKTLKVWDMQSSQSLTAFHLNEPLLSCAVAPDGQTVVAAGYSGRVHILRLEGT